MNTSITNQIIDFVIDNYTGLTNNQLKSLQNDIINSHELYHFNELIFDEIIYNANDSKFEIDQDILNDFSINCIKLIEDNLDKELSLKQQKNIKELIRKDLMGNRFSQNLRQKIKQAHFFVIIYQLSDNFIFRGFIMILILLNLLCLLIINKPFFIINLLVIVLSSSLFNYALLFIIDFFTPIISKLLGVQSLTIYTEQILYHAMILLIISLVIVFYLLKKAIMSDKYCHL